MSIYRCCECDYNQDSDDGCEECSHHEFGLICPKCLERIEEEKNEDDIEKVYRKFWKPIVEKDGVLDTEQVKKELYDFYNIIQNVPKVYSHITNGLLSKPNYPADVVINVSDDCQQDLLDSLVCQECGSKNWDYE